MIHLVRIFKGFMKLLMSFGVLVFLTFIILTQFLIADNLNYLWIYGIFLIPCCWVVGRTNK